MGFIELPVCQVKYMLGFCAGEFTLTDFSLAVVCCGVQSPHTDISSTVVLTRVLCAYGSDWTGQNESFSKKLVHVLSVAVVM
jgi:hypothetical protein